MATRKRKCTAVPPQERGVSQEEVQPWHRLGGMEHICELRKNASVLYSILVTVMRSIYATKGGRTFGCPDVLWSPDPQKTQIWIDTELRWEDTRPDFTPAIFVCLSDIQYDFIPTLDGSGLTLLRPEGEACYERTGKCSATFMHICDRAGEAAALADNTENYLSMLQAQIADQYCFEHFTVIGRTPLRKKEVPQSAGKDKIVSSVSVSFDFSDAWTVKSESPILKVVSLKMKSGDPAFEVAGDVLKLPELGVEVEFGDVSAETDTPNDA